MDNGRSIGKAYPVLKERRHGSNKEDERRYEGMSSGKPYRLLPGRTLPDGGMKEPLAHWERKPKGTMTSGNSKAPTREVGALYIEKGSVRLDLPLTLMY